MTFSGVCIAVGCVSLVMGIFCGIMIHIWWLARSKKLEPIERKKKREIRKQLRKIRNRQYLYQRYLEQQSKRTNQNKSP